MSHSKLVEEVAEVSKRWIDTPYYNVVEKSAQKQWDNLIEPFISEYNIDFSKTLELSVGHGRMTNILLAKADEVIGVDVLQENIDFCTERFDDQGNLILIKNNGVDLQDVESNSISFAICFDSMVHFDADVVRSYLEEFYRVLAPNGYVFCHHSNNDKNPEGDFNYAPHARNYMSQSLFRYFAFKSGLKVVKSERIDWGKGKNHFKELDCFTLAQKVE